jgi:hypothetical protein
MSSDKAKPVTPSIDTSGRGAGVLGEREGRSRYRAALDGHPPYGAPEPDGRAALWSRQDRDHPGALPRIAQLGVGVRKRRPIWPSSM